MESGSGGTNKRCPAQGIRYETEFKSEDKDGCLPFRGMRRWEILAHCIIAALQRIQVIYSNKHLFNLCICIS